MAAIWPNVEKTTKPANTDVAQLIVLVTRASLQRQHIDTQSIAEQISLPVAIVMEFVVRRER